MLRAPSIPGEVWVHFNRFGESGGRVWTVQLCPANGGRRRVWIVAHVVLEGRFESHFDGENARQPRCYFKAQATVEVRHRRAVVRAREENA